MHRDFEPLRALYKCIFKISGRVLVKARCLEQAVLVEIAYNIIAQVRSRRLVWRTIRLELFVCLFDYFSIYSEVAYSKATSEHVQITISRCDIGKEILAINLKL